MDPDASSPLPVDRSIPAAWSTRELVLLLGITALAAVLRLFRLEAWSWSGDEARTWRAITAPFDAADGFFAMPESNHPLGFLLLRWLCDTGILHDAGEGWLRLPFAFAGTLAVPLLAVLARGLLGNGAALVAAALLSIHPEHIHVSQSAHPLGFAFVLGLVGVTAVQRGLRWPAAIPLLAAGACDPLGWSAALVAVATRAPRHWQQRVLVAAAVAAVPALVLSAVCLSPAVLILAGAGLCVLQPFPTGIALGVALPAACAAIGALGGRNVSGDAVVALPALLVLAAAAVVRIDALARPQLPGPVFLSRVVPALTAVAAVAWLGAETFLYATLQHGRRPPWREAKDAVLVAADKGGRLVVGAAAGAGSLTYYLRPNHWRASSHDPHPGVAVVPLDFADPLAAVRGFAANADAPHVVLVLHASEVSTITADPAAASELAASFSLLYVIPGPGVTQDDTLWVYRQLPPR